MRRIYMIRHAHPDFPLGAHVCLGRTDTPLGMAGRMQACLLGETLRGDGLSAIFSSPLVRCRQTAAPLGREPVLVDAFAEQDMGVWDGLDFDAIRAGWPTLYALRAGQPLLVPPGAESLAAVRERVLPALERCLAESTGDIAILAHASVIQVVLAELERVPLAESRRFRLPHTGRAVLEAGAELRVGQILPPPCPPLSPPLAEKLLVSAAPGPRVEAHCRAVATEAERIAKALPLPLDLDLLVSAALLHDIARAEKEHARVGADTLLTLGYADAAALVRQHHDRQADRLDEAAVLYLADKCVREDRRVPLDERFRMSALRCGSEEAKVAHAARYREALRLKELVNTICGRPVVD